MLPSLRSAHAVESKEIASFPARVITNVVIALAGLLSVTALTILAAS
jgi:hypothetical protein